MNPVVFQPQHLMRLLIGVLVWLLWFGWPDRAVAQSSSDIKLSLAQVRTSFVDRGNSENVCGVIYASGFVVDSSRGLVLTSLHGTRPELPADCQGDFKPVTDIKIGPFGDSQWIRGSLFAKSKPSDAAVFSVGRLSSPPPALQLCQLDEPSFLAEFQIFGFVTFDYEEAVISPPTSRSFEFNSIQTLEDWRLGETSLLWIGSGNGEQGMSGGPVIDSTNGRVIGMYAGAVDSGTEVPSDFRLVVPLNAMERDRLFLANAIPVQPCGGALLEDERLDAKKCDDTWLSASVVGPCFNYMIQTGMYVETITHRVVGQDIQSRYVWKGVRPDRNICFISCILMPSETYVYFDGSLQSQGFSRTSRASTTSPANGIELLSGVWLSETITDCSMLIEHNQCP